MRIITKNADETKTYGEKLGKKLLRAKKNEAQVIVLSGELGAGKTTLVKAIAQGLGIKEPISSPTFTLMQEYLFSSERILCHIDLYRLENFADILKLGLNDLMGQPGNIVIIEWGERIKNFLPKDTLLIELKHREGDQREIVVSARAKMKNVK